MRRKDPNRSSTEVLSLARCREILELSPGAGPGEIKKAFRHLAFEWHPDRFPNSDSRLRKRAEERFKQLNAAYQMLMTASIAGSVSKGFRPASTRQARRGKTTAPPAARTRRGVPVMVGLFLALTLCAGAVLIGYRYLAMQPVNRDLRGRMEISGARMEASSAQPDKQPPPALDGSIPGKRPPVSAYATAEKELPASRTPVTTPDQSGAGSNALSEPSPTQKERLTIAALISAGESLAGEGRYGEAQERYRTALAKIASAGHRHASLQDLQLQIEQALESDEIRLGANGYHLYDGRWFSPEAYRAEFIDYRGKRVHFSSLKPAVEQFADPLVRAHLRAVFSSRLIHKNNVACTGLHLQDNRPSAARFQALYRWEVWTFEGVDKGKLTLEMVYRPREDRWEAVQLTRGWPHPDGAKKPAASSRQP
jgi:hypothetical protein